MRLKIAGISSYLFLLVFLLPVFLLGQASGLGLRIDSKNKTAPTMQKKIILPLLGNKLNSKGHSFERPFGAGLHGFYYNQSFTASNLIIQDSTGKVSIRPDTMIQNTTAGEYNLSIRPNIWLFPFLNLYAIAGYTEGEINPGLFIPSFTLNIEDVGSLPIDTSFSLTDKLKYHGPTYGFGAMIALAGKWIFGNLDYHYSETLPDDMEGKLYYHYVSVKAGIHFNTKSNKQTFAIWLGSMYIDNNQTFSSTVDIEELSPEIADIIGKTAGYSGDVEPVNPVNVLAGGSWSIQKHHIISLEAGFFMRQQVSLHYEFRW